MTFCAQDPLHTCLPIIAVLQILKNPTHSEKLDRINRIFQDLHVDLD